MSAFLRLTVLSLALTVCATAMTTDLASAQEAEVVESHVQGTVGLGIIGAELGFVLPAVFGADGWWPYVVFPAVGAIGGSLLGYFLIDQNQERDVGVVMLTTGIALALPTLILTLFFTAYDPEDEGLQEYDGSDPSEESSEESADQSVFSGRPGGLVQLRNERWQVGIPTVGVRASTPAADPQLWTGSDLAYEVSLVSGSF